MVRVTVLPGWTVAPSVKAGDWETTSPEATVSLNTGVGSITTLTLNC